jgi:TPR repeat protein
MHFLFKPFTPLAWLALSVSSHAHIIATAPEALHFTQTPGWPDLLQSAAHSGKDIQFTIAKIFDEETAYENSQTLALQWYERAASQGHLQAMIEVGIAYQLGFGVAIDEARAELWFAKAAEMNFIKGNYYLGELYQHAHDAKIQNNHRAKENYEIAAAQEDLQASIKLSELLLTKPEFAAQLARVPTLLRKSLINDDQQAWYLMGMYYSHPQSPEYRHNMAMNYFRRAAKAQHHLAQYELLMGFPGDSLADPVHAYQTLYQ